MASLFARLRASSPFFLIAGPNVIESEAHCVHMATRIKEIAQGLGLEYVFKASFDKANRTSPMSFRGPGLERGLQTLRAVREQAGVPVLTDVHESSQVARVAEVADVLQIPAFLCRQTDLITAAAATRKVVHIKKGQWCAAEVMVAAAEKARAAGNGHVVVCERGTQFGYDDLVVDPRNLVRLRRARALVTADVTHALQRPGRAVDDLGAISAAGERELIPAVARAAAAVGVDGFFIEVHDDPDASPCDAQTQWPLHRLAELLTELAAIARASSGRTATPAAHAPGSC